MSNQNTADEKLISQLVPLAEPLRPLYGEKIAKKDAGVAGQCP